MAKMYCTFRKGVMNGKLNKVYRIARNEYERNPSDGELLAQAVWLEEVHNYIANSDNYRDGTCVANGRMYGLIRKALALCKYV